jgi:hypothetical protein
VLLWRSNSKDWHLFVASLRSLTNHCMFVV